MSKQKLNARELKFRAKQQVSNKFPQRSNWWGMSEEPNSDAVEKLVKKVIR
ncbi:hypothetical protein [Clostridium botulinum]|uniref:hypothetical protein n=1 Tax=Clostridium botulinum TaxID=1491 RepID=UPI000ADAAC88|nr:hypothetical protein [Clostridium botulinum]MBY6932121.1 hypothetical protein [Clostridium botulinum]